MTEASGGQNGTRGKATILVVSGDFEKLFAAFSIAIGAAASNMDVTMFFSFWGLRALKKDERTGQGLFARMLGLLESGDINAASPGKYKFFGLGRWMIKKMLKDKNVSDLAELRQTALDLGVKMYCCGISLEVMEIPREKLIDEVVDVAGVGLLVEQAQQSQFTYSF